MPAAQPAGRCSTQVHAALPPLLMHVTVCAGMHVSMCRHADPIHCARARPLTRHTPLSPLHTGTHGSHCHLRAPPCCYCTACASAATIWYVHAGNTHPTSPQQSMRLRCSLAIMLRMASRHTHTLPHTCSHTHTHKPLSPAAAVVAACAVVVEACWGEAEAVAAAAVS